MLVQTVRGYCGKLHFDPADDGSLALQDVSGFTGELYLDLADNTCPWLSRW